MAETNVTEGAVKEPSGITETVADGQTAGESVTTDQITVKGTGQGGESFFDYESIKDKPELVSIYKEMQRGLTTKSEAFKAGADKIAQYDQFIANPVATMQQLAQQYGYQMVQGTPTTEDGKPKTYNNWADVESAADERAEKRLNERLNPVINELQTMKKQNVEHALDNAHPDWRTYEDSMMKNLQLYPELVNDTEMLYRMSIPAEVLAARATKAALAKIQGTNESALIQGQSATTKSVNKIPQVSSFNDAVNSAHQTLAAKHITRPMRE